MPTPTTAQPLTWAALPQVGAEVAVPGYDRESLRRSIVHIGVGGFHRAHLAAYIDELCAAGHREWSIVGAGVLPGDSAMADVLGRQDHLYTLITRGADETSVRVIGSIVDYIHAAPSADELIERIAAPDTQIVSLTVTEGGYPIDDTTGEYQPTSPTAGPGSSFAIIAAGLDLRRRRGLAPVTVISCDNIIENGRAARTATLGEAGRIDPDLAAWIDEHVAFPNSMVDRITPATGETDRTWLAEQCGIIDDWPVVTEPFRQWVIEDRFAGDRPPLEELDVIVTDDVEPYELMKLRLLNAGHSCLAYLAALDGIERVDGALAEPHIRTFLSRFLHTEARHAVPSVEGVDLDDYIDSLIERFSNPNIGDQIARLCLDGSAKFPKFLIPTIRSRLADGGPVDLSALALAGWCHYLVVGNDPASAIELSPDPDLEHAVQHAMASVENPAAFLDFDAVFDPPLRSGPFAQAFVDALTALRAGGVRSAIDAVSS